MKLLRYLFSVVLLSGLLLCGMYCFFKEGQRRNAPPEQAKINELINGKENYDMLFLGSSRTFVHVNPKVIDSITGASSYNGGSSAANLLEMNLFLQCYLEKHSPPRYVIMDLAPNAFDIDFRPIYNPAKYYSFLGDSIIYRTIGNYKKAGLLKYVPFMQLTGWEDEDKMAAINGWLGKKAANRSYKGYLETNADTLALPFSGFSTAVRFTIRENGLDLLNKIVATCKARDIQLVITYAPEYDLVKNDYKQFFTTVDSISRANELPFWDYRNLPLCRDHRLFRDAIHLNKIGAQRYSEILAGDIKKLEIQAPEKDGELLGKR